jgi:DNA repair exonuclease SbcCD ATPase subunit
MKITKVEIKNMFSIPSATVNFKNKGMITLIDGYNHDRNTGSGSGKSSIVNSICYGLYGVIPKNVKISKILKRGEKSGYVKVDIISSTNKKYSVKRCRPNKVTFYEDDKEIIMNQKEFEKILNLNYDQFTMGVLFSQSTYGRFITLNDTDKKNFITRLLNYDIIKKYKEYSDNKAKSISSTIQDLLNKKSNLEGNVEAQSNSIKRLDEIKQEIEEQIKTTEGFKNKLNETPMPEQVDTSEYDSIESKLQKKLYKINEEKGQRYSIESQIEHLKNEIKNPSWKRNSLSLECPHCNKLITMKKNGSVITNEKELIESLEQEMKVLQDKLNTMTDNVTEDTNKINDLISKIKNKKQNITEKYYEDIQYIDYLKNEIRMLEISTNSLISNKNELTEMANNIDKLLKDIKQIEKNIQLESDEIDIYRTISGIFSPTGLAAYISDNVIEMFNGFVDSYIKKMWDNIEYKLCSYKEDSKGDIVAKYDHLFIIDGKEEVELGNFSGGEFRTLSLCVDLAVIDLLESSIGITISPVFLDEAFDGLSLNDKEKAVNMLEEIAKNKDIEVIVIDHASEFKDMFNNIIFCTKKDGNTQVFLQ